ncbi:MAG: hypothetical protein MJK15_02595 [Colwellia sp.]|nr:hypothetical protein [Colwellia sp.]
MNEKTYPEYLKNISTIKALIFALLCLAVAINFTVDNLDEISTNRNYILPVFCVILSTALGIQTKTVAGIFIGSAMGAALTFAVPALMV